MRHFLMDVEANHVERRVRAGEDVDEIARDIAKKHQVQPQAVHDYVAHSPALMRIVHGEKPVEKPAKK